ncbi:uncharacterized protein LOC116145325 [Pistacia vera]|uniref:uncharacterized protein LOC116145325 n=1 Tax=Pistacia vera TaxID=55513 RepID=UPI0012630877|nr:uncharacterized protein LOC116145325 [Pistacia vera]
MGTEVQSKMYLPGYYSLRDLNDNTGSGSWSLCQQSNMFGQYHDFFLTRQAIDVNEEHDKQHLRQTILKHESMFRHQLHELHRIYHIQRGMMNEMRSRELNKHLIPERLSQSSLYSSGFSFTDDKGRQHISSLSTVDLNHGRLSMSGADSFQCQFGSMKENAMQSSYGPNQTGLRLKDYETSESDCKKQQRRLIDLELPSEEYVNDEKEGQGVSGVSVGSYFLSRDHEMTRERVGNSSFYPGVISGCKNDGFSSSSYMRNPHGLSNLNEHVKVKEASVSASTNVLGNIICSKEELERHFPSPYSHSGFHCLDNKFSQDPRKGKERGISFSNLHVETERQQNGWSGCNLEAGQTGSNGGPLHASFCHEDLPATSKSQQVEPRNSSFSKFILSEQKNRESHQKKKLFGVEICESNRGASTEAFRTPIQHPHVPQSNAANSESSSISSWKKLYPGSSRNMIMVQGQPSVSTLTQSNKSSVTLMHSPDVVGDKLVLSSSSRSAPNTRAEALYQNDLCFGSQLESKESWVCHSSNGFGHPNGISDSSSASEHFAERGPRNNFRDLGSIMDAKFTEEKKADAVSPNSYQNETITQPAIVSINGTRKQNPHGGLPWLKAVPSCNGNSSEERQGSSQMNGDSLQNCSQQFFDKTEMMRKSSLQTFVQDSLSATCALDAEHWKTEVGECSSNRKILGFSIFEKPYKSKDLATPSRPSKPSYLATVDGTKANDPTSHEFGEQHKVDGLMEKGLVNHSADSRHHIDLNLCVVEEEVEELAQPTLSSSRSSRKIALEIDLEAPAVETEMDLPPGFEHFKSSKLHFDSSKPPGFEHFNSSKPPGFEHFNSKTPGVELLDGKPPGFEHFDSKVKGPVNLLQVVSKELHEGLKQVAAEALVAISSSCVPHQADSYSHDSGDSLSDPLDWFADIASGYKGDVQNEVGSVSMDRESVNPEHSFPNGMDYFELMTLNLTETKVEECCYEPQVFENSKTENIMLKRPRRGQARRGRQRKDFQRDVLPTLASLLKNEVTEDLQTIEGLIKATGGTWQSSLALKNAARNGGGKRRRRSGGSDSPPNVPTSCPPQTEPPKCREVAFEEASLLGWGKRTRRPPRQRYPIGSPPLSIK